LCWLSRTNHRNVVAYDFGHLVVHEPATSRGVSARGSTDLDGVIRAAYAAAVLAHDDERAEKLPAMLRPAASKQSVAS
jgi:hypothetical protein